MKTRYKIIIISLLSLIPISFFVPEVFLIFYITKFETNEKCNMLNGNWDWVNNICELGDSGIPDANLKCIDEGGIPACSATCRAYNIWTPWHTIQPKICPLKCEYACSFEN